MNVFTKNKQRNLVILVLLIILIAIPLTVSIIRYQQQSRSNAQPSTVLSFTPTSSSTSPLTYQAGDSIPLTITIDPGSNIVSTVNLDIAYDATKLEPAPDQAIVPDSTVFPSVLEGPVLTPGRIQVSLSIGADVGRAIKTPATIATVRFKALSDTASPTSVTFGPATQVYSLGPGDGYSENVLSSTNPAYIAIAPLASPTVQQPTIVPSTAPTATDVPVPTDTPTPPDSTKPTISITSPQNGAIVQRRTDVIISATASDNIGVDHVTFSVGGNTSTDFTAPYSYSWSVAGKPKAKYTITATAYDAANNSASQSISVTSNK